MARTRTAAKGRPKKTTAATAKAGWARRLPAAGLRRLLVFSRPRSASELLALLLVVLALSFLVVLSVRQAIRSQSPGMADLWGAALLTLAAGVRLAPWWRAHLASISADRVRNYLSSVLILLIAISVSWRVLGPELGLPATYPLLGPFDGPVAGPFLLCALFLIALAILLNVPMRRWTLGAGHFISRALQRFRDQSLIEAADLEYPPALAQETPDITPENRTRSAVGQTGSNATGGKSGRAVRSEFVATGEADPRAPSPPLEIFTPAPKGPATPVDLEHKARRIQETLASFNVGARVVGHHCGPVVTQFDVQPDRGVKVRRITELQNDLALALAAPTIRIQAPVPGKPVVGIEIPNDSATMVALRDLLESEAYAAVKSPLKVVLGKDVAGDPMVIDLARMPHLLIAGATGSGKSACINALISCLLYQNTPENVRLLMIDPKMVELTVYNGVPHLLSPVVTQTDRVVGVLQWAVREMERRYQLFADVAVRNIQRYNEKSDGAGLKKLPYIVLVVDELADLMMVAPEDVEGAICRLAQLARAAGIHVVIATQRPSVDVVTGLIKANFPARIAFAMTSQVDSRTILDTVGAEKLLGRGDMLYLPPDASRTVRLQGAYLSDGEIERLVEFWRRSPLQEAVNQVPEEEFSAAEKEVGEMEDELLTEAIRVVREYQHASVSLLQRRLKVGYSRAARLMDRLEAQNVVGPADGSKQRPVLQDGGSGEG